MAQRIDITPTCVMPAGAASPTERSHRGIVTFPHAFSPIVKLLTGTADPRILAGLLHLGSGVELGVFLIF